MPCNGKQEACTTKIFTLAPRYTDEGILLSIAKTGSSNVYFSVSLVLYTETPSLGQLSNVTPDLDPSTNKQQ